MPVCSAALSCLTILPGEPSTREPGGTFIPAVTSAWAPMMERAPTIAPIKKDHAHPDEHLVVHRAGMDDGRVAHRDQFADERRKFIGHMDNDAVLNVCAWTDLDAVDVAAQDGAVPDTGLRANDTSPMIVVILKLVMIVVIAFTKGEPGEKQRVERSAPS